MRDPVKFESPKAQWALTAQTFPAIEPRQRTHANRTRECAVSFGAIAQSSQSPRFNERDQRHSAAFRARRRVSICRWQRSVAARLLPQTKPHEKRRVLGVMPGAVIFRESLRFALGQPRYWSPWPFTTPQVVLADQK